MKYLILIYFVFLASCQLGEPKKIHGITFLKNRSEKLNINLSNMNDTIRIMGHPHSKSIENPNEWFYIERTFTKGDFHKLGQHILKENNVLFLSFDKYGILQNKNFLNKDRRNKVEFTKNETENEMTRASFVQKFLTSIKEKMYGNK